MFPNDHIRLEPSDPQLLFTTSFVPSLRTNMLIVAGASSGHDTSRGPRHGVAPAMAAEVKYISQVTSFHKCSKKFHFQTILELSTSHSSLHLSKNLQLYTRQPASPGAAALDSQGDAFISRAAPKSLPSIMKGIRIVYLPKNEVVDRYLRSERKMWSII